MYGLKQSPRMWFGKFNLAVKEFGMQKSKSNHPVFYRTSSSGIIMLVMYMDDIVITGSDSKVFHLLSPFFRANFIQRTQGC